MSRPRVRTRESWSSQGKITNPDDTIHSPSFFKTLVERTEDAVGSRQQANFFSVERFEVKPTYMNGSWSYFGIPLTAENYADTRTQTDSAPHDLDGVSFDPIGGASLVLARTNPSRPTVALPTAIAELRDLPHMFKGLGDRWFRSPGRRPQYGDPPSEFLSIEFGWKPLVRDLWSLFNVSASIDKRIEELNGLRRNGGLGRDFQIARTSRYNESTVDLQTLLMGVSGLRTSKTTSRTWGSVRWVPVGGLPPTDRKMRQLVRQSLLGLGSSGFSQASNLWNAIPWTWLLDWCGNMGDFLAAHNNTVPVIYQNLCYMQQVDTDVILTPKSGLPSGVAGGGGRISRSSKSRVVVNTLALTASLPFLSGKQSAILGAIIASRKNAVIAR